MNRGFDAIMSSELPPEQKTQAYCIMAKAVSLLDELPRADAFQQAVDLLEGKL